MTAHNGNTEQDERGLLPYPVIIAATKGAPEAMKIFVIKNETPLAICNIKECQSMAAKKISCRYVWKTRCEYLSALN